MLGSFLDAGDTAVNKIKIPLLELPVRGYLDGGVK